MPTGIRVPVAATGCLICRLQVLLPADGRHGRPQIAHLPAAKRLPQLVQTTGTVAVVGIVCPKASGWLRRGFACAYKQA